MSSYAYKYYSRNWHIGMLHNISCCYSSRNLEEVQRLWLHIWKPSERGRCVQACVARRGLDSMEKKAISSDPIAQAVVAKEQEAGWGGFVARGGEQGQDRHLSGSEGIG